MAKLTTALKIIKSFYDEEEYGEGFDNA